MPGCCFDRRNTGVMNITVSCFWEKPVPCQGATPMSLEGAKKLSLCETEPKAKRARNDQQKKQGKTLRTWVASRWTSERFSMLSYDPDLIPILFDFVSEMGTDPVAVSVPASRFRNALYTTLDRSEALILRRFRGIRVALMSLGKVGKEVATISAQDAARQCSVFGISP